MSRLAAALLLALQLSTVQAQTLPIGGRLTAFDAPKESEDFYVDSLGDIVVRSFLFGGAAFDGGGKEMGRVAGAMWGMGSGHAGSVWVSRIESGCAGCSTPVFDFRLEELVPGTKGLTSKRSLKVDFKPSDVCAIGDRIFVVEGMIPRRPLPRALIREVDASGKTVRAFGDREKRDDPPLSKRDDLLNDLSKLTCVPKTNTIYFASVLLGVVRAFSADGTELWRRVIPQFEPTAFRGPQGGSYGEPVKPGGFYDSVEGLSVDSDGRILVGLRRETVRGRTRSNEYELRILDPGSGDELGRQRTDGAVVGIGNGRVYMYSSRPEQILVHRLGAGRD